MNTYRLSKDPIPPRYRNAKLDEQKVLEMRRLRFEEAWTYSAIGSRFGVGTLTARNAVLGKTWGST